MKLNMTIISTLLSSARPRVRQPRRRGVWRAARPGQTLRRLLLGRHQIPRGRRADPPDRHPARLRPGPEAAPAAVGRPIGPHGLPGGADRVLGPSATTRQGGSVSLVLMDAVLQQVHVEHVEVKWWNMFMLNMFTFRAAICACGTCSGSVQKHVLVEHVQKMFKHGLISVFQVDCVSNIC